MNSDQLRDVVLVNCIIEPTGRNDYRLSDIYVTRAICSFVLIHIHLDNLYKFFSSIYKLI